MKYSHIQEPLLEFGEGTCVCPRKGISMYHVYDTKLSARRERILVGAIGTSDNLSKFSTWIERCSQHIPPKLKSHQPELFTAFCGFNRHRGFKAELVLGEELTRPLKNSDIRKIIKIQNWNTRVEEAVELFYRPVKFLAQNRVVDVIVCIVPTELYEKIAKEEQKPVEEDIDEPEQDDSIEMNFRRALKARVMHLGTPIQLMKELSLESNPKTQQDNATKAWNFCTALYYKANQTVPWKLVTDINKPSICFVGIGFYRSRDKKQLHTSLAQIFDELGNNVILRGTPVEKKGDRRPHLSAEQAYELLKNALTEYEIALDNSPGRLVIHKSSNYNNEELDGFYEATNEMRVNTVDFVTILDTDIRLLRDGHYPPYRGTHITLDKSTHLLYTRGSVEYYNTYTGLYIPQPLEIRIVESDESPGVICREILSLTKMNWNNTQFDGKFPITLECARKVGQIMKYLGEHEAPQISYSFYM